MTEKEVIDYIIERYKSYKNKSFVSLVDCCGMDCENCPFKVTECADGVIMAIIDRFVKAEESQKAETNLEHYASKSFNERYGLSPFMSRDTDTLAIALKDGWEKTFNWSDPIQWLLSPYEEPKPKYKLSKFEYDLLKCYSASPERITTHWALCRMHEKGYFKGIPTNVAVADIIADCEVIDE